MRRRAVVYIRESTEEQGKGYSPDGQRGAIAQFAERNSLRLVGEYLDLESGTKADTRKDFQRLIADAMTGAFDVVLVFHTSRFARNAMEAKQYKKLLREELGIDVISVTQSIGTDTDDPTAFLNESINEVFDEYYSRSLSFWTKMGLAQKARQGLVTGRLPWGYLRGDDDGIAIPDPERAPVVLALFTIYATGNHSFRDLANWLNTRGFRTTRSGLFCSDTVRDMIGNLSYAGFVTAQRSTSREIKGKHEPIISEELFDRCAELRRQRTTTKNPGRPSQRFVLKSIARCERYQGRMYGQNTGRKGMPRYYCSTRRKREGCDQPLAPAVPIEQQLAEFVSEFTPSPEMRDEIMARLVAKEPAEPDADRRRRTLKDRIKRLRDLYEMGDIEKAEYRAKCAEIDEALDSMAPGPTADLDRARAVLDDFGRFWQDETDPVKRRELLGQLFERVWIDDSRIVAVRPSSAFTPFFNRPTNDNAAPERSGEVENTGATGVKPALCTSKESRSALASC